MAKYCLKCGSELTQGAKFCTECGSPVPQAPQRSAQQRPQQSVQQPIQQQAQLVQPTQPFTIYPLPETTPVKKKKRTAAKIIPILAFLLVASILVTGFWQPGFFIKKSEPASENDPASEDENFFVYTPENEEDGLLANLSEEDFAPFDMESAGASSLKFDDAAYQKTPETAAVDLEHSEVNLNSGVTVRFNDFCLTEEPQTLEVKTLGNIEDDDYKAVGYDFTLDGEGAEFCGVVEITLPYDPKWGSNVFVQYLNENTGAWEIMYSESNGDGNVTIYTDHFCTFAVFKDMVSRGKGDASGSILEEVKGVTDIQTKIKVNWAVLAAKVREDKIQSDAKLSDLTNKDNAYFTDHALNFLDISNTGIDYINNITAIPGVKMLTEPLGKALLIYKFFNSTQKYGLSKAIDKHGVDLGMVGVGMLSTVPGPIGWGCAAIAFGYYMYSSIKTYKDYKHFDGLDSMTEYAYRTFTQQYVTYNVKTGNLGALYFRDSDEYYNWTKTNKKFYTKYGNRHLKSCSDKEKNTAWRQVFDNARKVEKSGKMSAGEYVDKVIDAYCDVFWEFQKKNPQEFNRFLTYTYKDDSQLLSEYKTPSKDDIKLYKQNMKNSLYAWLSPYIEEMARQDYYTSLNSVYSYFLKLEQKFNEEYTIELIDPRVDFFADSEYAKHPIALSKGEGGEPLFTQYWMKVKTCYIKFTAASWAKYGCPKTLRILGSKKDVWDFKSTYYKQELDIKPGVNTFTLGTPEEQPEEDLLEAYLGTWLLNAGKEVNLNMVIERDNITMPIFTGGYNDNLYNDPRNYTVKTFSIYNYAPSSNNSAAVTFSLKDKDGKMCFAQFTKIKKVSKTLWLLEYSEEGWRCSQLEYTRVE